MQEIDRAEAQPVSQPVAEISATPEDGCGMPPPAPMGMPPKPDIPPPSMSVNLNAQGMENIEDMMKLFQKVNPDMMKPEMPSAMPMPSMVDIKPELPPLKMLPDMDADNDDMPGGELDMMKIDLDKDGDDVDLDLDGDDDHMEPDGDEGPEPKMPSDDDGDEEGDDEDEKKEKDEAWDNEPDVSEKDVDYMNNKLAGGMNRPKDTFPKVSDGDNPMKRVHETDAFRESIKAELRRRLEEAKGAK